MSWMIHAFWIVLTYDLSEDRCTDDIAIDKMVVFYLSYKTNRLPVAVGLYSDK